MLRLEFHTWEGRIPDNVYDLVLLLCHAFKKLDDIENGLTVQDILTRCRPPTGVKSVMLLLDVHLSIQLSSRPEAIASAASGGLTCSSEIQGAIANSESIPSTCIHFSMLAGAQRLYPSKPNQRFYFL